MSIPSEIIDTWTIVHVLILKNEEEILCVCEDDIESHSYVKSLCRSDVKVSLYSWGIDENQPLTRMRLLYEDLYIDLMDHNNHRIFCLIKGSEGWGLVDSITEDEDRIVMMEIFNKRYDNGDFHREISEAIDWLKPGTYPIYDPLLNVIDHFTVSK